MLFNNLHGPTSAIVLDQDAISLATQHLGFNPNGDIYVIRTDDLRYHEVVHRTHSDVFIDIAGADNNIPTAFVERQFIDVVVVVVANFHTKNAVENARVEAGNQMYSEVFGSCVAITSRFEGIVIIAAVAYASTVPEDAEDVGNFGYTLDIEKA